METSGIALGVPPTIMNLVQQGLLERAFHDGLVPAFLFRGEAQEEEWQGNTGQEILMTRAGMLDPITEPAVPGVDPLPQALTWEQWTARLDRFIGTIQVDMPTNAIANSDIFLRSIQQLGIQAGQSLNRIPRNALVTAYLQGSTCLILAAIAGDTSLQVASLNGFQTVITRGTTVRPTPVSTGAPLSITVISGVTATTHNVIGATPLDPAVPNGPGTLLLDAAFGGAGAVIRASVLASTRPIIMRAGGGNSVDAITANDIVQYQDFINATNKLRQNNVFPHEDGFYHAHISPEGNGQIFTDPVLQRLNQAHPDSVQFQSAFIGTGGGIAFFLNNETPDDTNSGTLIATGTNAKFAKGIGAEVVNEGGIRIGRVVITGRGAIYERWLDEKRYVSEAGITGKIGGFNILNQGIEIKTDRVSLILRSPINLTQDVVSCTWSYTGGFPIPTDISSGGPQIVKRAVMLEYALGS
jgi:hypothetical protein